MTVHQENKIRSLIQSKSAQKQIAAALPDHMTPERFTRVLLTAMNKTPKIMQCTQSSVLEAMMTCAQIGLEPDGRHAHLIPYGNKCQLIVDYKGLIELAYRSGRVLNIEAAVVYEGDKFNYGTCEHVPWEWRTDAAKPDEKGNPIGAFSIVEMKDGSMHRERMTLDEISRIRERSKAKSDGPWVTDWDEMAKKSVFRRASKWVPTSAQIQQALSRVEDDGGAVDDVVLTIADVAGAIEEQPQDEKETVDAN